MLRTEQATHVPQFHLTERHRRALASADADMLAPDGSRRLRFLFDAGEFLHKEELRIASYRETSGEPMIIRRALAFAKICQHWHTPIRPDELIVGSQRGNVWWRGTDSPASDEEEAQARELDPQRAELDIHFGEGHVVCDYERILREGLKAQVARIDELLTSAPEDDPRRVTWRAMRTTCEAARTFARRYAAAARELAEESVPERAAELREIARICERVPWEPAASFREALQSFWFQHLLLHVESPAVALSPGRSDQYLYPYYAADVESGAITREHASDALGCLWLKFREGDESQNLIIGGISRDGADATNELSYLMLEATGELNAFQPSLSVRVHRDTPPEFLLKAAELSARGTGQPSFFCDEVVQASLRSVGTVDEDVWDWAIVGCYEAVVQGAEWGRTVAGGASLPHAVLRALQAKPGSFESLMQATHCELAADVAAAVEAANAHEAHEAEWAPSPFQSVLMRDCIEKGLDIYSGGARYNLSACWPGCLATGVDSLMAVKRLVYDQGQIGLDELLAALEDDFATTEDLRRMLVYRAPKFGNDDAEVDALAREVAEAFCAEVIAHRNPRGGTFQPALAMYQVHYRGEETGATPDGRHAGESFSAGIAPTRGRNAHGVTATLSSCARLPQNLAPDGSFLIISVPPDAVRGAAGHERLADLIRTYFDQGGSQLMVNVVDAATLRDAQRNPESHRDLMVRISGLSAYFTTLAKNIQDDIIARTEQGL